MHILPHLWAEGGHGRAQEELFIKFAEFEEKVKEVDRARAIYRYALDHIPREQARPGAGLLYYALPGVDDTQNHVLLGGASCCVSAFALLTIWTSTCCLHNPYLHLRL